MRFPSHLLQTATFRSEPRLVARPNPMPYRAPTPVFDTSGQPSYAAAAKQKAQAEAGGQFDSGGDTGLAMVVAQHQLPVIRPAQGQLAPRGSFRPDYSGLMPASLTIGAHFSASMRKSAASSAGVDGLTGAPIAS